MHVDSSWCTVGTRIIYGYIICGDSINPGDTLNSSTYIVSEKGTFALGFFHRIDSTTTTTNTYLAISKMAEADQILPFNLFVWFGSRDRPIVNNSGMLTLDNNGTLKIVQKGGDPIVLYSPPQPTKNTVATLLDSGNQYITKSWSVAFNSAAPTLRHISCHVILFIKKIIFPSIFKWFL